MTTTHVFAAIAGVRILKRIGMVAIIAVIFLGWIAIPGALAAELTVTRTDDPSPETPARQTTARCERP